jgi:uncharacterized LabA/DUF88 family protein
MGQGRLALASHLSPENWRHVTKAASSGKRRRRSRAGLSLQFRNLYIYPRAWAECSRKDDLFGRPTLDHHGLSEFLLYYRLSWGYDMPSEARSPRLAVLIDADNASAKIADGLFEEIAKIGEASVRRIYGDFSNARSKGWADTLSKHAIIPQQQFAYTTGKNASDITLVIDAMDLLHSGRFDGFCLVSSDSDFTRLAARIREQGIDVFGFGEQKTPESFRQACRRFVYTENLLSGVANSQDAGSTSKSLQPPSAATPIIEKIISQIESEDGWVSLRDVGTQLANFASDFDPRTFGFRKLGDLVRRTNSFDIDHPKGGSIRIRTKSPAGSPPKSKTGTKTAT